MPPGTSRRACGGLHFVLSFVDRPTLERFCGTPAMQRKQVLLSAGLVAVVAGVVLTVILLRPDESHRGVPGKNYTMTVKVLVPDAPSGGWHKDPVVIIDGEEMKGEGTEHTHRVSTDHEFLEIATRLEPNNYTKIT